MSEEKKRKKLSRANTQDCTNAKGASDSPTRGNQKDFFIGTTA